MAFKEGQAVCWLELDSTKPENSTIACGVIAKIINRDEVKLEGEKYPRYAAFLYPDTPECRSFMLEGVQLLIKQNAESDAHMKRTYEFNNELVRKGMK